MTDKQAVLEKAVNSLNNRQEIDEKSPQANNRQIDRQIVTEAIVDNSLAQSYKGYLILYQKMNRGSNNNINNII